MTIDELIKKHGFENYSLIADTDEYKLYYVYLNKVAEGCVGLPMLAIQIKDECRLCQNRENRLFVQKYIDSIRDIIKMRKAKYGVSN